MTSTTATNLGANNDNNAEQSAPPVPSTSYACNTCRISFQHGQEQRMHMKGPWHVYNIKRRIASLPPIPLNVFEAQIQKSVDVSEASSSTGNDDKPADSEDEQSAFPFQCLFCNQAFEADDTGFAANLEHMSTVHGMSIPDPELVINMQSFIGYLATEVRTWHECLYCGATKDSTVSIQSHMRDKGHCQLNFDREPELLDFWERNEGSDEGDDEAKLEPERLTRLSETEMRFTSGKVVGSRRTASAAKKASRERRIAASRMQALLPSSEGAESSSAAQVDEESSALIATAPQVASGRQLARREEMGIAGVTPQQRQALVLAEKKAQRTEAVARRAREWVYAKGANAQEFDQLDGKMKHGKQNHKLLPR